MARPFLKWAGGKRQLLPEIIARSPARARVYYEPFLGCGAAFFAGSTGATSIQQVLFFSFTTLTTTGYGNLVPYQNPGQTLAVSEMMLGQLFLIAGMGKIVTAWQPKRWTGGAPPA